MNELCVRIIHNKHITESDKDSCYLGIVRCVVLDKL